MDFKVDKVFRLIKQIITLKIMYFCEKLYSIYLQRKCERHLLLKKTCQKLTRKKISSK